MGLLTLAAWSVHAQSTALATLEVGDQVSGSVAFDDGNGGVDIRNDLRKLDKAKSYDLNLLTTDCPSVAPFDTAKTSKLQGAIAAKGTRTLAKMKGDGSNPPQAKGLRVADMIGKGVVLMQGRLAIQCATVMPPFGPPPFPK